MKYNSLYDQILEMDPDFEINVFIQGCTRNFGKVLDTTQRLLASPSTTKNGLTELIFEPVRIIRAGLDYLTTSEQKLEYMKKSTALVKEIYTGRENAPKMLAEFREYAQKSVPHLMPLDIVQTCDRVSWKASHPHNSLETLTCILEEAKQDDLLFIALGHGGISAGLDLFLRHQEQVPSNSQFYPVRFSRYKKKDKVPQINALELDYLRTHADKEVVVFDEDSYVGTTLEKASNYFMSELAIDSVIVATNAHKGESPKVFRKTKI